jgi:hypothetical protein
MLDVNPISGQQELEGRGILCHEFERSFFAPKAAVVGASAF